MNSVLIDTNVYSEFKRGNPNVLEVLDAAPTIWVNATVLGELLSGFATGSREAESRQELAAFLALPEVEQMNVDADTAEHYALVFRQLKAIGRPIPTNDMWVAATALQYDLALFSFDQHFAAVQDLTIGTSLADFEA